MTQYRIEHNVKTDQYRIMHYVNLNTGKSYPAGRPDVFGWIHCLAPGSLFEAIYSTQADAEEALEEIMENEQKRIDEVCPDNWKPIGEVKSV